MSWTLIRDAMLEMVDDMTVANEYNYNWSVILRGDLPNEYDACLQIVSIAENENSSDIETLDIRSDSGSSGSGTSLYANERKFGIYLRVYDCQEDAEKQDMIVRLQNVETALEKAKDDFLKRFATPELDINNLLDICLVETFKMEDLTIQKTDEAHILRPEFYKVRCRLRYRQKRK